MEITQDTSPRGSKRKAGEETAPRRIKVEDQGSNNVRSHVTADEFHLGP